MSLIFKPVTPVSALHGNGPSFLGPLRLMLKIFKCPPKRFSRGCFFSTVWTLNMQIIIIILPTITHVCEHRVKSWQRSDHLWRQIFHSKRCHAAQKILFCMSSHTAASSIVQMNSAEPPIAAGPSPPPSRCQSPAQGQEPPESYPVQVRSTQGWWWRGPCLRSSLRGPSLSPHPLRGAPARGVLIPEVQLYYPVFVTDELSFVARKWWEGLRSLPQVFLSPLFFLLPPPSPLLSAFPLTILRLGPDNCHSLLLSHPKWRLRGSWTRVWTNLAFSRSGKIPSLAGSDW